MTFVGVLLLFTVLVIPCCLYDLCLSSAVVARCSPSKGLFPECLASLIRRLKRILLGTYGVLLELVRGF